jgi:hypothetical protein
MYTDIFNWLNVHSETFVAGGDVESVASKSWITESVPELHRFSADDICLKTDNLCAILIANGKPSDAHVAVLKEVNKSLIDTGDRGASVKFMWLNKLEETEFAKVFETEGVPALAVLKTGKRNRYVLHEGALEEESIV